MRGSENGRDSSKHDNERGEGNHFRFGKEERVGGVVKRMLSRYPKRQESGGARSTRRRLKGGRRKWLAKLAVVLIM